MMGAMPPPGMYALNYFNYTTMDSLRDNSGHKTPVDFQGYAVIDVMRFLYVSKLKLFGADVIAHAVVGAAKAHASMNVPGVGRLSQSKAGLTDFTIGPFGLAWHFSKNFHLAAGIDYILPTGEYDKQNLVNVGRNYWTINPLFVFTYIHDKGFEVSAKPMYFLNFKNTATDYKSGDGFGVDYLVGQHIGPWSLGINGYYYQQMTNDKSNGDTVDNYKRRVFSYGPAVQFNHKNMFFTLKYQWEDGVRNAPKSDRLWFKFVYAF
jgi:hypothetical protein